MSRYNKVSKELLDELLALLGKHNMTVDPEKLDTFKTDEETNPIYFHTPEVVVFPESTEQVAGVMKLANKYKVPVTPRGGGSSLAAAFLEEFVPEGTPWNPLDIAGSAETAKGCAYAQKGASGVMIETLVHLLARS